jgi:hypothetical protein
VIVFELPVAFTLISGTRSASTRISSTAIACGATWKSYHRVRAHRHVHQEVAAILSRKGTSAGTLQVNLNARQGFARLGVRDHSCDLPDLCARGVHADKQHERRDYGQDMRNER